MGRGNCQTPDEQALAAGRRSARRVRFRESIARAVADIKAGQQRMRRLPSGRSKQALKL
jgi:hypothetical protein